MPAKPNRLSDCQTIELVNPANLPDNYICQFDLKSFWCVVRSAFLRVRLTLWIQCGVCVIFACKIGSKQAAYVPQQAACNMAYVACIFMLLPDAEQFLQSTKTDRCADRNIC